jgi:hypothetical protein
MVGALTPPTNPNRGILQVWEPTRKEKEMMGVETRHTDHPPEGVT